MPVDDVFDDRARLREHDIAIANDGRLAEGMDFLERIRRGTVRSPQMQLELVCEAELFHQPDDALGT